MAEIADQLGYRTDLMDKACYLAAHNCAMLLYLSFQRGNAQGTLRGLPDQVGSLGPGIFLLNVQKFFCQSVVELPAGLTGRLAAGYNVTVSPAGKSATLWQKNF